MDGNETKKQNAVSIGYSPRACDVDMLSYFCTKSRPQKICSIHILLAKMQVCGGAHGTGFHFPCVVPDPAKSAENTPIG